MDYPDDGEVEDMDTTPSPIEEDIATETNHREVITIKEEQIEACELIGDDGEEDEEEQQFTETEQQIQDIMEENDRPGFEADLEKYLKTDTSDRAAIHATIQKNRFSGPQPYFPEGFEVCEFFPKKDWLGYYFIVDGHRMTLNTKRNNSVVFRCKYQESGCSARYRISTGSIGKANRHNHKSVPKQRKLEEENKHFNCVYCNEKFADLAERKAHILNEPHVNAPWPMDEELCIFAEFTDQKTNNSGDGPADKLDAPESVHKLLPNCDKISGRLLITAKNDFIILRPNEKRPPIYPKSLPYPHVPKNTPIRGKVRTETLMSCSPSPSPSPVVSETDSNEATEESVLKIKNSVVKKKDTGTAETIRRSSRPKERVENYATERKSDRQLRVKDIEETDSGRSSPATKTVQVVKKNKHKDIEETNSGRSSPATKTVQVVIKKKHKDIEETNSGRSSPATKTVQVVIKKKHKDIEETNSGSSSPATKTVQVVIKKKPKDIEETNSGRSSPATKTVQVVKKKKHKDIEETVSGRSSPATKTVQVVKKKKHKDDEIRSVPQRIENVIEEYENKVVLHCDLCDVKLNSLKHRADHNLSEEHQENKKRLIEENARCRASLAFNKPIFTEEFLVYNKALEAELRSLRKGAVELEEQNAVLSSHITELTDVVKELRNAKAIMQRQHSTLDLHLKDLKSELSKVFANVLSTEVSSENFNETFNKLSVAITGKNGNKRGYSDGITTKLKRHLKQARIDTVAL